MLRGTSADVDVDLCANVGEPGIGEQPQELPSEERVQHTGGCQNLGHRRRDYLQVACVGSRVIGRAKPQSVTGLLSNTPPGRNAPTMCRRAFAGSETCSSR